MSREIKFRAFNGVDYITKPFTLLDIQNGKIQFASSDTIVMQYAGLKDKNGVEIYEGDILSKQVSDYDTEAYQAYEKSGYEVVEPMKTIVDYCTLEHFRYWLKNESFGYEGEDLESPTDWEVIGNIHQNPDLLK